MNKWDALKQFLEKVGRSQTMFSGHILMVMDELEKNPEWDLQRDGWTHID